MKKSPPQHNLSHIDISPTGPFAQRIVLEKILDWRGLVTHILEEETTLTEGDTSPRSFGLVNRGDLDRWRGILANYYNTENPHIIDFLRTLKMRGQLRSFVEFTLLRVLLARSGKTWRSIDKNIEKEKNGGLLAERYLMYALNHPLFIGTTKRDIPFSVYAGPHELEPKFEARGYSCDAFLNMSARGKPRQTYGLQFGVTLDSDVLTKKLTSLSLGKNNLNTPQSDILYSGSNGSRTPKYLKRYNPDGLILLHCENICTGFTNPDTLPSLMETHKRWFTGKKETGGPLDALPEKEKTDLRTLQESFSGALHTLQNLTTGSMNISEYTYTVSTDNHHTSLSHKPRLIKVARTDNQRLTLYSLYIFTNPHTHLS